MKLQIGETLKCLRREKGITQEELAEVLGVSCQSVSRWELGICYPDIELLPEISDFFAVTVDKLMCALFLSGDDDGNIPDWKENMQRYDAKITALGERIMKLCTRRTDSWRRRCTPTSLSGTVSLFLCSGLCTS